MHQCHVLGDVSFRVKGSEDDNEPYIVSLGFSTETGKNRSNRAGVQIGSISEKNKNELALTHKHSKKEKEDWETFTEPGEKIAVECKFDNESYSIVHFKFTNRESS